MDVDDVRPEVWKLTDVGVAAAIVSADELVGAVPRNEDDEDTLGWDEPSPPNLNLILRLGVGVVVI